MAKQIKMERSGGPVVMAVAVLRMERCYGMGSTMISMFHCHPVPLRKRYGKYKNVKNIFQNWSVWPYAQGRFVAPPDVLVLVIPYGTP